MTAVRLDVMEQVVTCEACGLAEQCTAPVFMSGPSPTTVAVLGEAPGEQEDGKGEPFIGPAGQMLRKYLTDAGFDLSTIAFINTVSCFPHGTPTWDHIEACRPNKDAQVALADPTFILCVGKVATKGVAPYLDLKHGRGRPWTVDGRVYMSTYHPAAALRNSNYEEAMADDIRTFREMVTAGVDEWRERIGFTCSGCSQEAYWMQPSGLMWCLAHVPAPDFEKAQAWRDRQIAEWDQALAEREAKRRDPGLQARVEAAHTPQVGANHPETSRAAAAKAAPRQGTQRLEIYNMIEASGPLGMTDDELEIQMGKSHQSVSATRNALMNDGLIFDSGTRRRTRYKNDAICWVVEDFKPIGQPVAAL